MTEHQQKFRKLYNARYILESELLNIHENITDAIDWEAMRFRVGRLVYKLKDVFSKLMQKNEELFDLASEAEKPNSVFPVLEHWLDDLTKSNSELFLAARSYIVSIAERETVCEGVNPLGQSKRSSIRTTSSMS